MTVQEHRRIKKMNTQAAADTGAVHIGFEDTTLLVFSVSVIVCLLIDFLCHRKDHEISFLSASLWSVFWIAVSLGFAGFLWYHFNLNAASLFISGYVLEKSLSVDNLFVIMAIFSWFNIPREFRRRVLYYGIIGAIVFRGIFVTVGSSLLYIGENSRSSQILASLTGWLGSTFGLSISPDTAGKMIELGIYILFSLCVFFTAVKMLKSRDSADECRDYSNHRAYRLGRILFPIWPKLHGHDFFMTRAAVAKEMQKPENNQLTIRRTGIIFATPLFLCLLVIELTDVMFSFDSVPAVIAVSREPLIVYSAMIFAILGLRSMYFVLESLKKYICHLEKSVIVLLFFIAFKLCYNSICEILETGYPIGNIANLLIILVILSAGIIASILFPVKKIQ